MLNIHVYNDTLNKISDTNNPKNSYKKSTDILKKSLQKHPQ